jgi:hypothetical protein
LTDWERVAQLRKKGASWEEVASDPKVDFDAPKGTNPGRALKSLYFARRSRAERSGEPERLGGGRTGDKGTTAGEGHRGAYIAVAVAAVLLASLGGYFLLFHPAPPSSNIVTYCGGEGSAAHYHVLLVIFHNGAQQPLPYDSSQSADIGYLDSPGYTNPSLYCPNGGIHALHTHDGSGIIHAELPPAVVATGVTPTLADFFTIWGEPLSSTAVWTFTGHVHATMLDMDNQKRTDISSNPGGCPLYSPPGGPLSNPYAIPGSLDFNGTNGNGQSGGTFDGEIIWLNVTSTGAAVGPIPASAGTWAGHDALAGSHNIRLALLATIRTLG